MEEAHDVERVVETSAAVKLAREQVQHTQYIDRVMDDSSCAWKMSTSIGTVVTRGLCVLEARDVKIELVLWMNSSSDSEGEVGIQIIGFG